MSINQLLLKTTTYNLFLIISICNKFIKSFKLLTFWLEQNHFRAIISIKPDQNHFGEQIDDLLLNFKN